MELEKIATNAVETSVVKTDRLTSFISRGDKEPCWDGNIYIHESKQHNKKNIKKVATQVKGKAVTSDQVSDSIKYRISKDDLTAYMMNGGTMFFVVYINKETGDPLQIYYTELLPIKIKEILKKDQKTYEVRFIKFPENNSEKTAVFVKFYGDAQRQASFAGKELPSIEDLTKRGVLESLTFHCTGYGNYRSPSSVPKIMDGKSLSIYANVKGCSCPVPVEYDDQGNQLVQNTDSNGRFHTDWLNMIYSRLKLAKALLSDDGAIFISIDDNELKNLMSIGYEIFGEECFVGAFVWKRRTSSAMDKHLISIDHEYVVCFSRNPGIVFWGKEKDYKNYSNPDNDPRGPWTTGDLTVGMNGDARLNQFYDLVDPKTGKVYPPNFNRVWSYIPESMAQLIADNRVIFPADTSKRPMLKRFASELHTANDPFSSWMDAVGLNTEGTRALANLFDGKGFFNYTKPLSLMKYILQQLAHSTDIVLDFFSGSATTAQTVMQMNAEDGGQRRFIMVQLPEACDKKSEAYKAGYTSICEIGKERIRRAGRKIKEQAGLAAHSLDIGFRVLRLDSSNMQDVYYNPANMVQSLLDLTTDNIKPDRTPEDLLFQVMLELGIMPSSTIMETTVADKRVFDVADGFLLACFDAGVTTETVTAIAKKQPYYAVFRDSSMADDSVATNFDQIFETYSPSTVRKVL